MSHRNKAASSSVPTVRGALAALCLALQLEQGDCAMGAAVMYEGAAATVGGAGASYSFLCFLIMMMALLLLSCLFSYRRGYRHGVTVTATLVRFEALDVESPAMIAHEVWKTPAGERVHLRSACDGVQNPTSSSTTPICLICLREQRLAAEREIQRRAEKSLESELAKLKLR